MYYSELLPPTSRRRRSTSYFLCFVSMCCFVALLCLVLCLASPWLFPVTGISYPDFKDMDKLNNAAYMQATDDYALHRKEFYCVMFDAGSTGTRVHVFKFHRLFDSWNHIKLVSEVFDHVQPGLSSFVNNHTHVSEYLAPLLQVVRQSVPQEQWQMTPMALYATAGLRLLSENKASSLIKEVWRIFRNLDFVTEKNKVAILDGINEGIFSWFTVNFLIDKLTHLADTEGALDLGGASTQITFVPESQASALSAPHGFMHKYHVLGQTFHLYTHSYLGLGLMAARLEMMGEEEEPEETRRAWVQKPITLRSPCIPPGHVNLWTHGGADYNITNDPTVPHGFWECYKTARSLIEEHHVHKPLEVKHEVFHAFSYYFDRAADAGIINKKSGGVITVWDFFHAAKRECSLFDSQHTFLCMDLSYISALLHHGFGFDKSAKLLLKKKINGVETSWSLGATFQLMDSIL